MRVVISDFGGVLTNPLAESFAAYRELTGIPLETLGEAMGAIERRDGEHPLCELEKGIMSEAQFSAAMEAELTRLMGRAIEFGSFPDAYFANLRPNDAFLDHLRLLKADDLRLMLLTNNVKEWEHRWREMLPIDELFEVVVDSGFVGTRKPERRIYEISLERLMALDGLDDIAPHECVLVDDLAVNCEAAERFGFRSVQFKETDQAIADLSAILGR